MEDTNVMDFQEFINIINDTNLVNYFGNKETLLELSVKNPRIYQLIVDFANLVYYVKSGNKLY